MVASGIQVYKRMKVRTAHPAQLVVMLYEDGAIRSLQHAIEALDRRDLAAAHDWLVRAQEVVLELRSTLNHRAGPIAEELQALYDVLHRKLVLANVRKDATLASEVLDHFRELLPAWQTAAKLAISGAAATPIIAAPPSAAAPAKR